MFWSGDINSTPKVKHCIHQKRFIRVSGIMGLVDYDESPNVFFNLHATCFNN